MIAVDTNVLVRLLTGDEPEQAWRSGELFARHRVFVPKTVVLETEWVLRYAYRFEPEAVVTGLRKLFGLVNVTRRGPARGEEGSRLAHPRARLRRRAPPGV